MRDGVRVLNKLPVCILVQFFNCTWQVHPTLEPGVFPLKPTQRTWIVNKEHGPKNARLGYTLLPHFASTCHSVQGLTLEAMLLECLGFKDNVKMDTMLQSYVGLSRVKLAIHMLLLRAFSPKLFQQGAPQGPALLMDVLRRRRRSVR